MNGNRILKEGDGIVYHYTSLDTFLKILDGVEFGHFIFHGTDVFSMNDPTEFIHGFRQLWSILPQIEKDLYNNIRRNPQTFDIDLCYLDKRYRLSNMWSNLNGSDKGWLKAYIEAMHQSYDSPFVISFSCNDDYLPMWSTYGDKGNGIAIGIEVQDYYKKKELDDGTVLIDFTKNDEHELRSLLVSYDKISVKHPLARYAWICIINYLRSFPNSDVDDQTLLCKQMIALDNITKFASALLKHEAYRYEEESRLIAYKQDIKEVKFKISSTKKVLPYIHIVIPISKLKRIVIGPCCNYNAVKNALKTRFEQLEIPIKDEDIAQSKIPYRVV